MQLHTQKLLSLHKALGLAETSAQLFPCPMTPTPAILCF